MWSDRHYYLYISKDKKLSSYVETKKLGNFLDSMPELTKVSDFSYNNSSIDLSILYAKSIDSWSSSDINPEKTNLLTIVCPKGDSVAFEKNKTMLIKIASFLNWQLVDEETEEGIEHSVIWTP